MVLLIAVSVVVGLVWGRIPAAVAERVFAGDSEALIVWSDFKRPFDVGHSRWPLLIGTQIASGLLFGVTAAVIGTHWVVIAYLWFVAVTLTLTLTDIDQKLIPNRILFPGFAIAFGVLAVGGALDTNLEGFARAIGGSAAYFVFLLVLALAARGGFGMGDVKLGALLGAFLAFEGWRILVVGAVGAFVLGGAVSLILLVFRIRGRKDAIPFGPYLVVAAYIAIVAGDSIADWYAG